MSPRIALVYATLPVLRGLLGLAGCAAAALQGGRIWLRTAGQLWCCGPEEERAGAQGRAGD